MEDLQTFEKMIIKSKINDYEVNFIDNLQNSINSNTNNNSFIIIDEKVYELFKNEIDLKNNFIKIKSN